MNVYSNSMKSGLFLIFSICLIAGFSCTAEKDDNLAPVLADKNIIGVEELMENPIMNKQFKVEGVVKTVNEEDNILALLDIAKYKECGLSDCCLYLPVRWGGPFPEVQQTINITGAISDDEDGKIFIATELNIVTEPEKEQEEEQEEKDNDA